MRKHQDRAKQAGGLMTRRVPLDDEQECAFWRTGAQAEGATEDRRILIGHQDEAIGASLTLLLALKKYQVVHASKITELRRYMESWRPHALILDTRLDADAQYAFVRSVRRDDHAGRLLILAMSNIYPLDSISTLKEAGFDGHVRRPCSVWRVTDLLDSHFHRCDD
ncbi:histidine kinase [Caballeronia sp. GAFFF1]|uniref:histidine kinase n=1 Tax=Caballeronia sp. GAFFF1 TaxID=2921779 RepID=UPI002028BEB9|nr:histidine kinase [Caballeronia sp. GAFFF1]